MKNGENRNASISSHTMWKNRKHIPDVAWGNESKFNMRLFWGTDEKGRLTSMFLFTKELLLALLTTQESKPTIF